MTMLCIIQNVWEILFSVLVYKQNTIDFLKLPVILKYMICSVQLYNASTWSSEIVVLDNGQFRLTLFEC